MTTGQAESAHSGQREPYLGSTRSLRTCCALALPSAALAVWIVHADYRATQPLDGLGYVLGAVLAVPAVVGVPLAVAGHRIRRRSPRLALALAAGGLYLTLAFAVGLVVLLGTFLVGNET